MQEKQIIQQMSQIDHVLHRPGMYIGSIVEEKKEDFCLENEIFVLKDRSSIPGLIKIFNEIIDNSIDEYVRTKAANKISVKITDTYFECSDNGLGIPNKLMKTLKGEMKYQAEVAFTEMLSGSNYNNDDQATIGTNGLGGKASSIFSNKSIIQNDDGKIKITITTKNNLKEHQTKESKSVKSGVSVKIFPDLKYFGIESIDEIHQTIIKERLLHLSVAYPDITFKFNNKTLRLNTKKYLQMFDVKEILHTSKYDIGICHAYSEQFESFGLVNGLVTKKGTHINVISNDIVQPIRDKLVKKFKTIKPGDIKNKIRVVVIMKDFMQARYDSQTKETLTNSEKEIRDYLKTKDYQKEMAKFVNKIQKNQDIILPISELFLLKEQAKQNVELKKLKKTKKIKSEKYLPATKRNKYIFLTEGESASGSLIPALGREECGYYMLKGMPLNAYDASQSKFTQNKELSELYQIIQNENYEYIIAATDQDLPGFTIRGILSGFIIRYLPEYVGKFGVLNTPVLLVKNNKTILRWYYSLQDDTKLKKNEKAKFLKGLGSSNSDELKEIVKQDGLHNMIRIFDFDNKEIIDDWLSGNKSDKRKEYLLNNNFDIAKA